LGPLDDFLIAYRYEAAYNRFVSRGIFTEAEKLDYLLKNNLWDQKKEKQIKNAQDTLVVLYENKRKVFSFNDINSYKDQIKAEEEFLLKTLQEKGEKLGETVESLAHREADSFIVTNYIFQDKECKTLLYSDEEFGALTVGEIESVFDLYKQFQDDLSDSNIKKISIHSLFTNLYFLSESPTDLFGQCLALLTHYQIKLVTWGGYFKSIFQSATVPAQIQDNPEGIEEWYHGRANIQAILDKAENQHGVVSIGGISNKELDFYGLQDPVSKNYSEKAGNTQVDSIEEAIRAGVLR